MSWSERKAKMSAQPGDGELETQRAALLEEANVLARRLKISGAGAKQQKAREMLDLAHVLLDEAERDDLAAAERRAAEAAAKRQAERERVIAQIAETEAAEKELDGRARAILSLMGIVIPDGVAIDERERRKLPEVVGYDLRQKRLRHHEAVQLLARMEREDSRAAAVQPVAAVAVAA